MSMFYIPCGTDPDVTYNVELEGIRYDFRFRYLQRQTNVATGSPILADEWLLILSVSGKSEILRTSLKTNRDLLSPYRYRENCPPGELQLRDITADISLSNNGDYSPERVGLDSLGQDKQFRLMYITSDSVV